MAEFDPGAGNLLGTNDLQQTVDKFNDAVNTLSSTVTNMSSTMSNGMTRSPSHSQNAEGATFSSQPGMGATQAAFVGGGSGGPGGSGGGGGGGNGWSGPQSNATQPGPGGGGRIGGSGGPPSSGMPTIGQIAGTAVASFQNAASNSNNNMLLYNAFGQAMQYQWGGSAQNAQNQAFGNGVSTINYAAAGDRQGAAQAYSQVASMNAGQVAGTAQQGMINALAMSNPGMGIADASNVAATAYNPARAFTQQMLTGVAAINPQTGAQVPIGQQLTQLAQSGYIAGFNSKTGRYSQQALAQSFTQGRGRTWSNLTSLGYSGSQIQDIQSMMSEANQVADKANVSDQTVMNYLSQAGGGPGVSKQQADNADKWLQQHGYNQSTITSQGRLASQGMAQEQSESSTYNTALQEGTKAVSAFTNAINTFLDKTGLNKVIGGAKGWTSSGNPLSPIINGALSMGVEMLGGIGGGAGSVSTTQPMTAQGNSTGSSLSAVSGAAQTAVRDAEQQVGKPYKYGGDTPQTSFDCSGLVMWAYGQAGVKLPRTSQQQWSSLKNKSVPLNQVREGDIVFTAGSDGTATAPGHEALMVSNRQIVEAPYTGANIRIRSYNPSEWQHAARPTGSTASTGSNSKSVSTQGGSVQSAGNTGAVSGGDSALGLTTDADSMLFSGGGTGPMTTTTNGGATSGSSTGSSTSSQNFTGGGSASQNEALAKKMAQALYGWTGNQWTDGLLPLWTQESGFRTDATNSQSGAYGIPQSLPGSKMASAGSDWKTNPATQIKWGLEYIRQRYSSPVNAEAHERAYSWYATGTPSADPGVALVGERGPELVHLTGGQSISNAAQTSSILRGTSAKSAQAPWTASPAQTLLLDPLSPANSTSSGSGGVNISFGNITIQTPGGAGGSGTSGTGFNTTSDTQALASAFQQGVEQAIQRTNLVSAIRQGNTG